MLHTPALTAALTGLVGWHQGAGATLLPTNLTESASGLYVQDVSELLTLGVLQHLVPAGETLGSWMTRLQADALQRFVPNLTAAQSLSGKVLLPQTPLVKQPGRIADTVNKLGRFVGLELEVRQIQVGVAYALPKISLQLDAVLTDALTLWLYSAADAAPLAKIDVPAGQNKRGYPYAIELPDAIDLSSMNGYGGKLWLGYYEDDLPAGVHAISAPVGPCGCTSDPFAVWSQYVRARPFAAPAQLVHWDTESVSYEGGTYGLLLEFLAYCDIVGALESPQNLASLAPLVQSAVAIRFLEALSNSTNITQLTGRQDVQADALRALYVLQAKLYGGKVPGTEEVYPSALKNLTLDLSGLDAACGPPKYSPLSMGSLTR